MQLNLERNSPGNYSLNAELNKEDFSLLKDYLDHESDIQRYDISLEKRGDKNFIKAAFLIDVKNETSVINSIEKILNKEM